MEHRQTHQSEKKKDVNEIITSSSFTNIFSNFIQLFVILSNIIRVYPIL